MLSTEAVLPLLLRFELRDPPAAGPAGPERTVVAAAAAFHAGEPRRALGILRADPPAPGDSTAVATALRMVSEVYDRNWFPGDGAAVFEPGDAQRLTDMAEPEASTPVGRLLVMVATQLVAAVPTWRRFTVDGPQIALVGLRQCVTALQHLQATAEPTATAAAALVLGDLLLRTGRDDDAGPYLAFAQQIYSGAGDRAGLGTCELTLGDRAAAPDTSPELLGERFEPRLPSAGPPPPSDFARAQRHWAAAEEHFTACESARGTAAIAVRRAATEVAAGRARRALPLLDRAAEHAAQAGDRAFGQLIAVHRALAAVEADGAVDLAAVGGAVGEWGATVGSRSYARGLARLCLERSGRLREVREAAGRRAHLLAEAINEPLGAVTEAALLRGDQAARYGVANFRRASLVLTTAGLDAARAAVPVPVPELEWGALVERLVAANADATALRDGDCLARLADTGRWLRGLAPSTGDFAEARAFLGMTVDELINNAAVFAPLYRGVAARAAGDEAAAQPDFDAALDEAERLGPLPTIVVLGNLHRYDEAQTWLRTLIAQGLPAEYAARLLVRLKLPAEAMAAIAAVERQGGFSAADQPWEAPALRAEALLGVGELAAAAEQATAAITAFERHLASLAVDVFRTMANDDLTVAGMYTTAVRAYAGLAGPDTTALAESFQLSDRCRASSLSEVVGLDRDAGGAADDALRAWQRAGAELARTVEQVGLLDTTTRTPADIHRTVRAAERGLDDAATALDRAAPRLLSSRRRLPVTPRLAALQRRLDPDTLLLQYHAFDDELIGWAITRDSARVVRTARPTVPLTVDVRRWHRALSRPWPTDPDHEALGRILTDALLAPFASELLGHGGRLVVVPHGPLAVLPFHALPWGDDVLGAAHTVSYLPAASMLPDGSEASGRIGRDTPAAILGDPAYAPGRALRPLPGAALEAEAIANLYGGRTLPDAADHGTVLTALERARVAHLATHGVLREGAPYSCELALAGTASLTVPDLVGMRGSVDLVVLSACDSGRGRATAAGDLIGLTRALLSAGVRDLVVSLWPVDDRIACLTMIELHRRLIGGSGVGAALAGAQQRLRVTSATEADTQYRQLGGADPAADRTVRSLRDFGKEVPSAELTDDPGHPFYWAPFVHIGTW